MSPHCENESRPSTLKNMTQRQKRHRNLVMKILYIKELFMSFNHSIEILMRKNHSLRCPCRPRSVKYCSCAIYIYILVLEFFIISIFPFGKVVFLFCWIFQLNRRNHLQISKLRILFNFSNNLQLLLCTYQNYLYFCLS